MNENENEMNFQYIEDLEFRFMNSNFELKEIGLNEHSAEKSSNNEEKI